MPSPEKNVAEVSPLGGWPAPNEMLVDVGQLEREYLSAILSEVQTIVNNALL
jgi:hypothetical protein